MSFVLFFRSRTVALSVFFSLPSAFSLWHFSLRFYRCSFFCLGKLWQFSQSMVWFLLFSLCKLGPSIGWFGCRFLWLFFGSFRLVLQFMFLLLLAYIFSNLSSGDVKWTLCNAGSWMGCIAANFMLAVRCLCKGWNSDWFFFLPGKVFLDDSLFSSILIFASGAEQCYPNLYFLSELFRAQVTQLLEFVHPFSSSLIEAMITCTRSYSDNLICMF